LYSEYPIVQTFSSRHDPQKLEVEVKTLLDGAKLKYQAMTSTDERLEIRFLTTDIQLLAVMSLNMVGSQYTVALNLAASTPHGYRLSC